MLVLTNFLKKPNTETTIPYNMLKKMSKVSVSCFNRQSPRNGPEPMIGNEWAP